MGKAKIERLDGIFQSLLRKFPSTILDWALTRHLHAEVRVQKFLDRWVHLPRYVVSEG